MKVIVLSENPAVFEFRLDGRHLLEVQFASVAQARAVTLALNTYFARENRTKPNGAPKSAA